MQEKKIDILLKFAQNRNSFELQSYIYKLTNFEITLLNSLNNSIFDYILIHVRILQQQFGHKIITENPNEENTENKALNDYLIKNSNSSIRDMDTPIACPFYASVSDFEGDNFSFHNIYLVGSSQIYETRNFIDNVNFITRFLHDKIIELLCIENKKIKIETNLSVTQSKTILDTVPFKVGLLFAKGQIYRKNLKQDFKYYYLENGNEKEFPNPSQLAKYLNLTRQYIDESFKDLNKTHNIFKSSKTMKNVYDYCIEKQIQMSEDFIQKYNSLNDSKS